MSKTTISKLALKYIVQHLSKVAGRDADSPSFLKVHAYCTDTVWILESTDGHRLATNMVDRSEIETDLGESLSFPFAYLDDFKFALSKAKNFGEDYMIDVSQITVQCGRSEFPDTKTLASETGYDWSISFNVEYLTGLLHAMRDDKRTACVTLKMRDPKAPIKVTCGGTSYGLLMPVRGDNTWGPYEASKAVGA